MGQRKPGGSRNRQCTRFHVGRVSVYLYHAAWWLYYRDHGEPIRRRVSSFREEAERLTAEINAQLTVSAPAMFAFTPVSVTELQQKFLTHHEQILRSSIATFSATGRQHDI